MDCGWRSRSRSMYTGQGRRRQGRHLGTCFYDDCSPALLSFSLSLRSCSITCLLQLQQEAVSHLDATRGYMMRTRGADAAESRHPRGFGRVPAHGADLLSAGVEAALLGHARPVLEVRADFPDHGCDSGDGDEADGRVRLPVGRPGVPATGGRPNVLGVSGSRDFAVRHVRVCAPLASLTSSVVSVALVEGAI